MEHLLKRLAFRHLRLIIAVAEERNMVGATKRLNMTQPAVTKALQEMEALLGIKLFLRTNRGVSPTIYGDALIQHARLIIAQLSHAAEELGDLRDGSGGRVVVGTLLAASAGLLPTAIARLRQERSKLVVKVTEGTNNLLLPGLRLGDLDFVVGRLPEFREREGLVQEVLVQDIACVVVRAGHPLVGKGKLGLRDLTGWDWILPTPETTLRRQLDRAFRDGGAEPPANAVESVSLLTNRALLVNANYLALWPWQVAHRELDTGQIAILPITIGTTQGSIGITTRSGVRLSPAAELLIQTLRLVSKEADPCPFLTDIPSNYSQLS